LLFLFKSFFLLDFSLLCSFLFLFLLLFVSLFDVIWRALLYLYIIKYYTYFIISSFSLKINLSSFLSIKLYSLISEKSAKPNPFEILLYESYIILHDFTLLYFFFKKSKSSSSLTKGSKLPI